MKIWFSAMLTFALHIGSIPTDRERSVFVFQAEGFDDALVRALEIGRSRESSWRNADGDHVEQFFVSIETLDMLGQDITDPREVHSEMGELTERGGLPPQYAPEKSRPGLSGV